MPLGERLLNGQSSADSATSSVTQRRPPRHGTNSSVPTKAETPNDIDDQSQDSSVSITRGKNYLR